MKLKKWLTLALILIIGLVPMVFVACGGNTQNNISLSITGGLDEPTLKTVYLTADDEQNASKDLYFTINNWSEAISNRLNLNTDSSAISISDPVYFANGVAKVTLTAVHGGTAVVTAKTVQFGKEITFIVKVEEKIKDFALKTETNQIVYEKESGDLILNLEDFIKFTPESTTEKNLLVYKGEACLTENNYTKISNLQEDTILTIVSPNLEGKTINLFVKVVESLQDEDIVLKSSTYTPEGEIEFAELQNGGTLTLLKGGVGASGLANELNLESKEVKLYIHSTEENLKVVPRVYTKSGAGWQLNNNIIAELVSKEYASGEHVYTYKVQYVGENELKMVFNFETYGHVYNPTKEIYVETKIAPTSLSINNINALEHNITVYEANEGYAGKSLKFIVYPEKSIDYEINLLLNENANKNLKVFNVHGIPKTRTQLEGGNNTQIQISNNETVYISANTSDSNSEQIDAILKYSFEGINFEIKIKINITIKKSPNKVILTKEDNQQGLARYDEITSYNFDLNTSKQIIGNNNTIIEYNDYSYIDLYFYADVNGILEKGHEFKILNNSGIVDVLVNENKLTIKAKSTGVGSFIVILETGKTLTFTFEVINSLSKLDLTFPTPSQNANVYSLTNLSDPDYMFDMIVLTNKQIYPTIVKSGDVKIEGFACQEVGQTGSIRYENGAFSTNQDFTAKDCMLIARYNYLNENNENKSVNIRYKFKLTSITKINKFTLSTNKGTTNFDLYDYSTVGFYSQSLSSAIITVDILPEVLKSSSYGDIVWKSNATNFRKIKTENNIDTYESNIFTFTYDTINGTGVIVCNVNAANSNDLFENNVLKSGKVILSANLTVEYSKTQTETISRSVQFDVLRNVPIESIGASSSQLSLDKFNNTTKLYTTIYPANASNRRLDAKFITNDLSIENALDLTWDNEVLIIKLNDGYESGEGVIRLIAYDSYSDSSTFKTYLEIPIIICDGTKEYPYQILDSEDLQILLDTEFSKYYNIVGEIDFAEFDSWEYSKYELTGHIIGVNNASFINVNISSSAARGTFFGLFKEISTGASMENLKISGAYSLDLTYTENETKTFKVGLVAAVNNGTLQNVYVELNKSNVKINNAYKLILGGVVGENTGNILTEISKTYYQTRLVKFNDELNITDVSDSESLQTLHVGGVTGENFGTIERISPENIAEVQNNYTTAEVKIVIASKKTNPGEGVADYIVSANTDDVMGIGAAVGYSENSITNLKTIGYIYAGKFVENKFIGHFNNVGGIVGYNSANITGGETQTYVYGGTNVGGAVGYQAGGDLSNLKVQALEKADRNGIYETLIIGNANVGGLVGNITSQSGDIKKCTFISYISKTPVKFSDNSNYCGDILAFEVLENVNVYVGRLSGSPDTVNYIDKFIYCVAIANIQTVTQNQIATNTDMDFAANHAIFGQEITIYTTSTENYVDNSILNTLCGKDDLTLSEKTEEEEFIETIIKYQASLQAGDINYTAYIILPPTKIIFDLTEEGLKNQLNKVDVDHKLITADDLIAFYIYYHQKADASYQSLFQELNTQEISSFITISTNSNTSVVVKSNNINILEVKDAKFIVKGTGLVKITVTSEFNTTLSKDFYVYVVNYVNALNTYLNPDRETKEITSDSQMVFDKDTSYMLYIKFLDKFNQNGYAEISQLKVLIKLEAGALFAGKSLSDLHFVQISTEAYQFTFNNILNDFKEISFIPYFEVEIEGSIYSSVYIDSDSKFVNKEINDLSEILFKYKVTLQTKSISASQTEIEVVPYYTPSVDFVLDTENASETITINTYLKNGNAYEFTDLLKWTLKGTNAVVSNLINLNGDTSFNLTFYLEESERDFNKNKEFKVEVVTSNGKMVVINITFKPQKINGINVNLYPLLTDDSENLIGSSNEIYGYIASHKIVAGQASLLEFLVVPSYSDFDYIIVQNASTNAYNLVFELYSREENIQIAGAYDIANGIKIPKALLQNGKFCLRAFLDDRVADDAAISIEIIAQKGNADAYPPFTKTYYVEHLPGVTVGIDNAISGNENAFKVAQGLEYKLNVIVRGYETGKLVYSPIDEAYIDGEVYFKVDQKDAVEIIKNADGTYSLIIKTGHTGEVTITTFGKKLTVNGYKESKKATFTIDIVKFVVKETTNSDIVTEVVNNVYTSAVGNTFELKISLNSNVLIFDRTNIEITNEVNNFLSDLASSAHWYIKDISGHYSGWHKLSEDNTRENFYNVTDAYQIEEQDERIIITFKKVVRQNAEKVKFKFNAKFEYKNGKPETLTDSGDLTLAQEFVIYVNEKTSLTNPYPIRSAEEFMNMVEGNYYILLENITLPNDFTPITTAIGGLDGNNKIITFPSNLQVNNTTNGSELNFGLFQTVAAGSLIKNVNLYINGETTITVADTFTSVNLGLIAAENNGTITNCAVIGTSLAHINVNVKDNVTYGGESSNQIAMFVATNNGSITHSRVEASITSVGNMAGFVYENQGTIASSYVYGSIANNTSITSAYTAGFVAINEFDSLIFTSYIKGEELENTPFATSLDKIIFTKNRASAFVFSNGGTISNCYANIPVSSSASRASGFVYTNLRSGKIEYSYSTSVMANNNTSHTMFIGRSVENLLNEGTLHECFAVGKITILDANFNTGLGSNENISGLQILEDISKLKDPNTFANFALSTDSSQTNGVWFIPSNKNLSSYVKNNGNVYINLNVNKPELVSPNIIAYGTQIANGTTYNEETGETIYLYKYNASIASEGSEHNPIVIDTVETLESLATASLQIGEGQYYRLVNNLTYETSTTSSVLYKQSFLGHLEGNSFKISNYVVDSAEELQYGGLFATLGTELKNIGSIKNTSFAPKYINLPNTNAVGAVAGISYGANLINITVDGFENDYEGVVILGKNVVGGLVGVAYGNYTANKITLNISVNSTYRANLKQADVEYFDGININRVSNAGALFGVATGNGKIKNIKVSGNNVAIAECAGLVFGFIDKNVNISNVEVRSSERQYVKADVFGGVIAGISKGKISGNIRIIDLLNRDSFFIYNVYKPIAIGNVVGYMVGGELSDIQIQSKTNVSTDIQFVGGAVGAMCGGKISNVVITGDITAGSNIGGIVGYVGELLANGFSSAPALNKLAAHATVTIENSYLAGNIASHSSGTEVRVGVVAALVNEINLTDEKNYVPADSTEISDGNVTIIIGSNITVPQSNIAIYNYNYNSGVEVWYGIVTGMKTDALHRVYKSTLLWKQADENKGKPFYIEAVITSFINNNNSVNGSPLQ